MSESKPKADYDRAIERVPQWIIGIGIVGTAVAAKVEGLAWSAAFFVGAAGAYVNFWLIERTVNRLGELALAQPGKPPKASGFRMFIRFALFILGAFVILSLSGFNLTAALCGFLVCPAAILMEIFYELLTYGHS